LLFSLLLVRQWEGLEIAESQKSTKTKIILCISIFFLYILYFNRYNNIILLNSYQQILFLIKLKKRHTRLFELKIMRSSFNYFKCYEVINKIIVDPKPISMVHCFKSNNFYCFIGINHIYLNVSIGNRYIDPSYYII